MKLNKLQRALHNVLRRGEKPLLIDVRDYPKAQYTAFFEYFVDRHTNTWRARVYDVETNVVLDEKFGRGANYYKAAAAAQRVIKDTMKNYRRV